MSESKAKERVVSGRERLARGFTQFLNDSVSSDAIVSIGGKEFYVHRILLMNASKFFSKAFSIPMQERELLRIELKFPDTKGVFPLILSWIYGGDITLTIDNVSAIAATSHQLIIDDLETICMHFLKEVLSPRTAIQLLNSSVRYEESTALGIIDTLVSYITENFQGFGRCGVKFDMSSLPFSTVIQILNADAFSADEDAIFDVARDYISGHSNELTMSQKIEIWKCLRLPQVSVIKLREAQKVDGFPQDFLVESLLVALENAKGQSGGGISGRMSPVQTIGARLPQRILEARRFVGEPEMAHGGWGIEGRNRDAICFTVDRNITLVGIGTLEGDISQNVEVTIDICQVEDSKSLVHHTTRYQSRGGKQPIQLSLPQIIPIKRGVLYCIEMLLHGKERLFTGSQGISSVIVHGVTFTFSETERSINGTNISSGQIPSLYFKLSFPQH